MEDAAPISSERPEARQRPVRLASTLGWTLLPLIDHALKIAPPSTTIDPRTAQVDPELSGTFHSGFITRPGVTEGLEKTLATGFVETPDDSLKAAVTKAATRKRSEAVFSMLS